MHYGVLAILTIYPYALMGWVCMASLTSVRFTLLFIYSVHGIYFEQPQFISRASAFILKATAIERVRECI